MDNPRRNALWESVYDADWRSRYYLKIKDRLQKRIRNLGTAIAILSCGPLTNFFWEVGVGDLLAGVTGAAAGIIGVYLAASGLPKALSTAISASTAWVKASNELHALWVRFEEGEDIWDEYRGIDEQLHSVDNSVIQDLEVDEDLVRTAQNETNRALAIQATS